ncbi:peptidase [Oligella urethralis]|uniref:ImmA/IrrE family metallo-endopeptidase n=1 Tax=Oligella urethralis TaxID=90245 RepID=UPI000CFFC94E|nr:ImmA/IrrE family metallo-endopeptidase [Oligella urethralis]AVL71573.1 peptidase [Oligella urethralis]
MSTAHINPQMLTWARERLGFSVSEFAKKIAQKEDKLAAWEAQMAKPTFKQAIDFAKKAQIPFSYLFLQEPPVEAPLLADLRTVGSHHLGKYSAELNDIIKLMQGRQFWYREFLLSEGASKLEFVGSYLNNLNVNELVKAIRNQLDLSTLKKRGNWEDYYRSLINKIEEVGVLVMRQSFLGHHTRPLRVEEFRGFALVDEYAPLIFINQADAPGPRLFTLMHEFAHLWIGVSGVSDLSANAEKDSERVCNAVAAELLVPETEFKKSWLVNLENWQEQLPSLAAHFHVSQWVIARRALTFGYIEPRSYQQFINAEKNAFQSREKQAGGPSYYRSKKSQMSPRFAKALINDALNGNTSLREAACLMQVKPANLTKFAKEL